MEMDSEDCLDCSRFGFMYGFENASKCRYNIVIDYGLFYLEMLCLMDHPLGGAIGQYISVLVAEAL